jgi:hypothetical protein
LFRLGTGSVSIDGTAKMAFGRRSNQSVTFGSAAEGTLKLGDSDLFSGVLPKFDDNDVLDLVDFLAGPSAMSLMRRARGGTLTV